MVAAGRTIDRQKRGGGARGEKTVIATLPCATGRRHGIRRGRDTRRRRSGNTAPAFSFIYSLGAVRPEISNSKRRYRQCGLPIRRVHRLSFRRGHTVGRTAVTVVFDFAFAILILMRSRCIRPPHTVDRYYGYIEKYACPYPPPSNLFLLYDLIGRENTNGKRVLTPIRKI